MSSHLEYKGYIGKFEIDTDTNTLHGAVINTRDIITFEGQSATELYQAFKDSIDDYLSWAHESGFEPHKPYSGKLLLRIDPALHQRISLQASLSGKSLNQWVGDTLKSIIN